jgi:Transposase IS116/IS110/IS902 family
LWRHYESGPIRWRSRIAKTGNGNLRTALYFPAISAMRYIHCFALLPIGYVSAASPT